ncbi:hypothetical protein GGI00_001028, partial [Coemansia sp. RSA 2681]
HRIVSRNTSTMSASVSASYATGSGPAAAAHRIEAQIQAPARGDLSTSANGHRALAIKDKPVAQTAAAAVPNDDSSSEISMDDIRKLIDNARLLHFVCAPLPISSAIKPSAADLRGFSRLFRVISAMLQNLADSYIDYLCSTGYIVARRFEKVLPWREALGGLGYEPEKVLYFTQTMLGLPRRRRSSSQNLPSSAEAMLPGIQTSCAYLIANTDRTNLVTQVEVNPQMLAIHMHALSRSTPEWRSAVPGYVKSSIKAQSIKHFTFELSKYKKLLHAKSFVYDFQLRYVASLLRTLEPALASPTGQPSAHDVSDSHARGHSIGAAQQHQAGGAPAHRCQQTATVYSSDSGADGVDSAESSDGADVAEHDRPAGASRKAGSRGTVAQLLHVHIDLMAFFAELDEQRYFSTRFSSRRLVRTRLPMTHREIYEYFLSHSERYHFYTDGCRPATARAAQSPQDKRLPLSSVCSDLATHSGCYRLYEGAIADGPHSQYAGFFEGTEMISEPGSMMWPPVGSRHEMLSRGAKIASSAPEPASKLAHTDSGSAINASRNSQHGHNHPLMFNSKGRGAHLYASNTRPHIHKHSSEQHAHGVDSSGKQIAASYAPVSQWWSNVAGKLCGSNQQPSSNYGLGAPPLSSSPLRVGSIKSHASKAAHVNHGGSRAESRAGRASYTTKSLEFALDEYSACKIHLSSNDTFVRVSLMALAPDCDSCRTETSLEAQKSKERQLSHANKQADGADGGDRGDQRRQRRHHHHHHRHRHRSKRGGQEGGSEEPPESRPLRHCRRKDRGNDTNPIDGIGSLFGSPEGKSMRGIKEPYHSGHPLSATATATATNIASARAGAGAERQRHRYGGSRSGTDRQAPLQQWMASLASDCITDAQADGLQGLAHPTHPTAAQLSFYLVVDMDPQTTIGLSSLQADDAHSRNGSLVPLHGSADHVGDSFADDIGLPGGRQCQGCRLLSLKVGRLRLCGIHKVLGAVQIDMRDWENKGDVWSKLPTMVMEVQEIDPDEYDKEDPDIVAWIQETARRVIKHAMVDYHRDFNWYLIYQRLRMADIPRGLAPSDIGDLVAFIERRSWIDVGPTDEAVQQLLELNISAQRIIEALQLRLRRIYLEPALLMTSLHATMAQAAAPHPAVVLQPAPPVFDDQLRSSCGRKSRMSAYGLGASSHANLSAMAQQGGGLAVDTDTPLALSRTSTRDPQLPVPSRVGATGCAFDDDPDVFTTASRMCHQCPTAAIDAQGHVLYGQSSSNVDEVLRLLSPLGSQASHKMLLDPSFQKTFSRFIQLSVADCPWLCRKHDQLTEVSPYNWAADSITADGDDEEVTAAAISGDDDNVSGAHRRHVRDGASVPAHLASRRVQQIQESRAAPVAGSGSGRVGGASIASLATADSSASSFKAHHTSTSVGGGSTEPAQLPHSLGAHNHGPSGMPAADTLAPSASTVPATDLFSHARVESLPGSLLIVDPEDKEHVARLIVLNPFAYHGVLELLFARSADGGEAKLDKIRAVARLRQRDGLHEYERKHINLALSTISAVVWDLATEEFA